MQPLIILKPFDLTVFPQIIAGGDYFFFSHEKGAIIRGRRLFQILLTGTRAQNKKNHYIKQTEHGRFECSKFGPLINFRGLNRH